MAAVYSEFVMGISDPKIGLLNVGEEKEKGSDELKQAHELLLTLPNFIGNIEGKDIMPCKADVFLSDGLLGNVLLKFGESLPAALAMLIKAEAQKSGLNDEQSLLMLGILKKALGLFHADDVGGVPFLGVNGITLVGHGASSATAIKNLVIGASKCLRHSVNDKMLNLIQ
jgi:glycerol-3-phosphate acyltransferase PlsX